MTQDALFKFGQEAVQEAMELARKKNRDYAKEHDALWNLKRGGPFGVAVRMDDKVGRLLNLLQPGKVAAVDDESARQTLVDMINYPWLCMALMEEGR